MRKVFFSVEQKKIYWQLTNCERLSVLENVGNFCGVLWNFCVNNVQSLFCKTVRPRNERSTYNFSQKGIRGTNFWSKINGKKVPFLIKKECNKLGIIVPSKYMLTNYIHGLVCYMNTSLYLNLLLQYKYVRCTCYRYRDNRVLGGHGFIFSEKGFVKSQLRRDYDRILKYRPAEVFHL